MNKDELLKIKEYALERHIPIIMDDTLEVIDKYLTEKKPEKILEIGTAVGYSAMCFSEYLRDGGKIDTIERDEERIAEAKENIKKVGVEEKINIYEGDAVEILPTMNDKYDVVFIDAAKGKYPFFLEHALRMLKDERLTSVDSSLTISPAFCNPRNAMKRPIPAGIAFLTASGIAVKSFVRIPVTVRIINTIPSNNTSTSALA